MDSTMLADTSGPHSQANRRGQADSPDWRDLSSPLEGQEMDGDEVGRLQGRFLETRQRDDQRPSERPSPGR
jgi:hypothetical protein